MGYVFLLFVFLHASVLDEVCQCLGPDEVLVVDCLGEVLAACAGSRVRVLDFDEFLTHGFKFLKGYY